METEWSTTWEWDTSRQDYFIRREYAPGQYEYWYSRESQSIRQPISDQQEQTQQPAHEQQSAGYGQPARGSTATVSTGYGTTGYVSTGLGTTGYESTGYQLYGSYGTTGNTYQYSNGLLSQQQQHHQQFQPTLATSSVLTPVSSQPTYATTYAAGSTAAQPAASEPTPQVNLQSSYRRVDVSKIPRFFVRGKVFSTLWTEPAGSGSTADKNIFEKVQLPDQTFAEVRRFVVVKAHSHHSVCLPISTYGGHGVVRRRDARLHSVIYNSDQFMEPPPLLPGETIDKYPIKMIPDGDTKEDSALLPESRINYSKVYTVEHNVKVKKIGRIPKEYMEWVKYYWKECMD